MILTLLALQVLFVFFASSYRKASHYTSQPYLVKKALSMAADDSILDQMRKTLGERSDAMEDAEKETKQLMKGLRDLDKDPNLRANNKFVEWLGENGVWVKVVSAWGRAPHPLVIASNTEADGEACGRGLLARETIGEGELLMTVPLDLCLTKAVAQEILGNDIISDEMDEYISIALLLMTEKVKGTQSRWKPYFDVLPDMQAVYPSFIWNDEELEMLKGSPIYYASLSLRYVISLLLLILSLLILLLLLILSFFFLCNLTSFLITKKSYIFFQIYL
jgi:hypothetical protein